LCLQLTGCVYDPPPIGKTISLHNQTDRSLFVSDSLTGKYFRLYDTVRINERSYIQKSSRFLNAYTFVELFYSNNELASFAKYRNNQLSFYLIDVSDRQEMSVTGLTNNSFRSFIINIDTIKKYELNHLFITKDTILLEHSFRYYNK
jgi:hypothetical protein